MTDCSVSNLQSIKTLGYSNHSILPYSLNMRFRRKKSRKSPDTVTIATAVMTAGTDPSSEQPAAPPRIPSPQIIEDRYIDDDKLLELCSQRFPPESYTLSVWTSLILIRKNPDADLNSTSPTDGTLTHLVGLTK